ncbi:MAG: hypothetical protein RIQ60_4420 [Pseudomonadota bacterium]|jgi:hypothetical protein
MFELQHLQESKEDYEETDQLLREYGTAMMVFHQDTPKKIVNNSDYSFLKLIHRVEDFVIRLAKSKENSYCHVELVDDVLNHNLPEDAQLALMRLSPLGAAFVKAPPSGFITMFMTSHHYNRLSPYFELYRLVMARYPLHQIFHQSDLYKHIIKKEGFLFLPKKQLQWCCDQINEMLRELKEAANREKFIKVVAAAKKRAAKNYKSFMDYFESLFQRHADLLVIRVDLGYAKAMPLFMFRNSIEGVREKIASAQPDRPATPFVEQGQETITAKEPSFHENLQRVMQDRDQLISHLRKRYGNDLIGYAWKLEHGNYKGFHVHLVVILNGATKSYDISHGHEIGEHWQTQITDRGTYFNCNAQKSKYRFCGVGPLNYRDHDLWLKIDKVVSYMTKVDLYAHLYVAERFGERIGRQAAEWGIDLSGAKNFNGIDLDAFDNIQPKPFKARIFGKAGLPKDQRKTDPSDQTPRRGRPRHGDLVGWKAVLRQKKKWPVPQGQATPPADAAWPDKSDLVL